MCLNETYCSMRVGKHLPGTFHIKKGLKKRRYFIATTSERCLRICYLEGLAKPEGLCYLEGLAKPEGLCYLEGLAKPEGLCYLEGLAKPEGLCYLEGLAKPEGFCY